MTKVHYYLRHPGNIYFSIEKLFREIGETINRENTGKFEITLLNLPLPTSFKNILKNISFVRNTQSDLNHITGDIHYAILGCNKRNINVLTIHDTVMLRRLKRSNPKFWFIKWIWYDLPVRKADMITVISENSKQDLIHFTGCDEKRIRVIGNFYDRSFQKSVKSFHRERPILLFIGTAENKNLDRLILALEGIQMQLHIVGHPSEAQIELLKRYNIPNQVSSGLSDEEMRQAYADCDILGFPSTYEGFGLPILEAQLTGRPVLTSNLSPMKEVAGKGAMLVDPYEPGSIRQGILKIIEDVGFREQLVKDGFENVKRYDPEVVAGQYAELYEELAVKKIKREK
jgi:glycosyltransferase involved in cell wall biosynthesis